MKWCLTERLGTTFGLCSVGCVRGWGLLLGDCVWDCCWVVNGEGCFGKYC